MKLPKYLEIKQEADTPEEADMYIMGEIVHEEWDDTDVSATGFMQALKSLQGVKQLNLHINSPGGNVFEGIAIYNMLKQSKMHINVYVDALAASIASVIAMSGDAIFMPKNSMLMIHNPMTDVAGNAKQLRKAADTLDQIGQLSVETYAQKCGKKVTKQEIQQLMDDETWLSADKAVELGFADEVLEADKAVACIDGKFAQSFKHMPKQLLEFNQKVDEKDIPAEADKPADEPKDEKPNLSEEKKWLESVAKESSSIVKAMEINLEQIKENF